MGVIRYFLLDIFHRSLLDALGDGIERGDFGFELELALKEFLLDLLQGASAFFCLMGGLVLEFAGFADFVGEGGYAG